MSLEILDRKNLKYHYKPKKGWVNDPNGLVYFDGYYHIFYQHCPNFNLPWKEPMCWGHARTKNFLDFEELPFAIVPDMPYDDDGCWSGTAIVKDDTLYIFYASITRDKETGERIQTTSVAYSKDGINFTKYEGNPVIDHYPSDGCPDFRDPAVEYIDGKYYCVIASGHKETKTGRLLIYESENLFDWKYDGVMAQWEDCEFVECPSFGKMGDKILLSASICPLNKPRYFHVMLGTFKDGKFTVEIESEIDKGPDQYAGQIFTDHKGRNILITWLPSWRYQGYAEEDLGCMSIPREIILKDGKLYGYPIEEVRHLLKDYDDEVELTDYGFIIKRKRQATVEHHGKIDKIEYIHDDYMLEVFVNGGESVYSLLMS